MLYKFKMDLNWGLTINLSQIDSFGGAWSFIEKREGHTLKQLKSIATVRSIGASTRIEGAKMTDEEVEVLIKNLEISKLKERDQQEVAGYFGVMDIISDSFRDIEISANNIKHLHNQLMKYSAKDEWHKGDYKQQSNEVEATRADGSKYTIFKTTEPGVSTDDAMNSIIDWYNNDKEVHPIVRSAVLLYEFLSIHPFQDGNGRLSRLLANLLLLKHGYSWIEYVSFEHEIENRKVEYYKVLMDCQRQRPREDVSEWILFFLDCLSNIQTQLKRKMEAYNNNATISPREKKIYEVIENRPGIKSGEVSEKLNIPLPTVKKIISEMVSAKLLVRHGTGAGTNYVVEPAVPVKKDLIMKFDKESWRKEFQLMDPRAVVEVKKIILTPTFDWIRPDDWATRLAKQGLYLEITCYNSKGASFQQSFAISSYNNPHYYQPVFTLSNPIVIPAALIDRDLNNYEYPINIVIELKSSAVELDFEVLLVYDEAGR